MDVGGGNPYPAGALSNFTPRRFVLDDIECSSMEGLLQSLKFENSDVQREICSLTGRAAKYRGAKRNKAWKRVQKLWWRGKEMSRDGEEYQLFLDKAYEAMYKQCAKFRKALEATNKAVLRHSIGKRKECDTVLTISEFCGRLTKLRDNGCCK